MNLQVLHVMPIKRSIVRHIKLTNDKNLGALSSDLIVNLHLNTSVRMVRTSLNSFVAPIKRFFRLSTTVVEWVVVSLEMFPLSFWELQRNWRSTKAELSALISCFTTAVSSWISRVGSSNTDVLFATGKKARQTC